MTLLKPVMEIGYVITTSIGIDMRHAFYLIQRKKKSMKLHSLFALNIILGASLLYGCASTDSPHQQQPVEAPDNVPAVLSVQASQTLMLVAKVSGVQIYECGVDRNNAAGYTWNFKAPEADLFDTRGRMIGKHYAGPTWEASDGSKVIGQFKASDKGSDTNAIPWLLLNAKSNSGRGLFEQTTSIQRLNTGGGKAPADGCDRTHLGNDARVPYTAQYYFYN